MNGLPTDHIDVYKTPEQFLACLLHWMKRRREGESTGMKLRKQAVATLIRRECHVFAGVGVYTVCEIFYLAGNLSIHDLKFLMLTRMYARPFPTHD